MPAEYSAQRLQVHFANIATRLEAIERQLATLSEKAGVSYAAPMAEVPADVVELVKSGKDREALKRYREITGASVEEAQAAIAGV
jgi:ribosomal protein L7/L12